MLLSSIFAKLPKHADRATRPLFCGLSFVYLSFALSILVFGSSICAQGIFKWVDEDGVTHFGNHPPSQGEYETISERTEKPEKTDPPAENKTGDEQPPDLSMPAYGEAYHKEAKKSATRIPVFLAKDFFLVNHEIGSSWLPYSCPLTSDPPVPLYNEPAYEGRSWLYGKLDLGTFPNRSRTFVFDLVDAPNPLLYFDVNGNGDLTDDGGPFYNQGSGIFATEIRIPVAGLIRELESKEDFSLWFFTNDSLWEKRNVSHYSKSQLKGTVLIEGRTYNAIVSERGTNDADFTNDGICVDWNGDGKFDRRSETVMPDHVVEVGGREYYFDISW